MKTLLLPFYDDDVAQAALAAAAVVAARFGSHIEGLFVLRPPQIIDGEGIVLADSYLTQLKEEGRHLGDRARQRFEAGVAERGIPLAALSESAGAISAGWREMEGLEGQVIGDYGRVFDLVALGRGFGHPWIDWHVMCEAALFESGRPVMVLPKAEFATIGSTVVIAWSGSTETARTVALGMPFLREAESVVVLSVDGWSVPGPDAGQMLAHLARNGIRVSSRTAGTDGRSPGETILDECDAVGADLLLKGAYTHSRLRQLVFGGATRHILLHAPLPVLFAH